MSRCYPIDMASASAPLPIIPQAQESPASAAPASHGTGLSGILGENGRPAIRFGDIRGHRRSASQIAPAITELGDPVSGCQRIDSLTSVNSTVPLLPEAVQQSTTTVLGYVWPLTKSIIWTAASYDYTLRIFILQLLLARRGAVAAAPDITGMLTVGGFLVFGAIFQEYLDLSELYGELHAEQRALTGNDTADKNDVISALNSVIASLPADSAEHQKLTSAKTLLAQTKATSLTVLMSALQTLRKDLLSLQSMQVDIAPQLVTELRNDMARYYVDMLQQKILRLPRNAFILGITMTPLVMVPMFLSERLLSALHQSSPIPADAQHFFKASTAFFPSVALRTVLEFVVLAEQNQFIATWVALASLTVAVAGIEYPLAFHASLDLAGLGIGFGVGDVLTMLGFAAIVYKKSTLRFFDPHILFSFSREDWRQIIRLIQKSCSTVASLLADFGALFALSLYAGHLPVTATDDPGKDWEGAFTFISAIAFVALAAAQRTSGLVNYQRGQAKVTKDYKEVVKVFKSGLVSMLPFVVPAATLAFAAPKNLLEWLGSNQDNPEAFNTLYLAAVYAIIDWIRYTVLQTLRALGDNNKASVLSAVGQWLGVAAAVLLSTYSKLGILSLPLGGIMGEVVGSGFLMRRLSILMSPAALKAADEREASQAAVADLLAASLV